MLVLMVLQKDSLAVLHILLSLGVRINVLRVAYLFLTDVQSFRLLKLGRQLLNIVAFQDNKISFSLLHALRPNAVAANTRFPPLNQL